MSTIATHADPIMRPLPGFLVRVAVDDVDPNGAWEQLWTRKVARGQYELSCLPFLAYGMAFGDLLEVDEKDDYRVRGVLRKSGNQLLRVAAVNVRHADEVHRILHDLLALLEYESEWYATGYVSIHLSRSRDHTELRHGIRSLENRIQAEEI